MHDMKCASKSLLLEAENTLSCFFHSVPELDDSFLVVFLKT